MEKFEKVFNTMMDFARQYKIRTGMALGGYAIYFVKRTGRCTLPGAVYGGKEGMR